MTDHTDAPDIVSRLRSSANAMRDRDSRNGVRRQYVNADAALHDAAAAEIDRLREENETLKAQVDELKPLAAVGRGRPYPTSGEQCEHCGILLADPTHAEVCSQNARSDVRP